MRSGFCWKKDFWKKISPLLIIADIICWLPTKEGSWCKAYRIMPPQFQMNCQRSALKKKRTFLTCSPSLFTNWTREMWYKYNERVSIVDTTMVIKKVSTIAIFWRRFWRRRKCDWIVMSLRRRLSNRYKLDRNFCALNYTKLFESINQRDEPLLVKKAILSTAKKRISQCEFLYNILFVRTNYEEIKLNTFTSELYFGLLSLWGRDDEKRIQSDQTSRF